MQVLLFLPVLHRGYEDFLKAARRAGARRILILGRSITDTYPELRKEIRALPPGRAMAYLNGVGDLPRAQVVEIEDLHSTLRLEDECWIPDEEACRRIVKDHGLRRHTKIHFHNTFLRWDRRSSQRGTPPNFDGRVTRQEFHQALGAVARSEGSRSSDWWRQVGAVAVRDGSVIEVAHNRHLPTEYSPYINSDPRGAYRRGVHIELSTALHAEASLIAKCAHDGISLLGADLFVSTFPCPGCARLIAESGVRRCFFGEGYSVLEGEQVLRAAGVELIWVDGLDAPTQNRQLSLEDLQGGEALSELTAKVRAPLRSELSSPLGDKAQADHREA